MNIEKITKGYIINLIKLTFSQELQFHNVCSMAEQSVRGGTSPERTTHRPCIPDQMFTTGNNGAGVSLINSLRSLHSHGRLSSDISSDKPVFLGSVTGLCPAHLLFKTPIGYTSWYLEIAFGPDVSRVALNRSVQIDVARATRSTCRENVRRPRARMNTLLATRILSSLNAHLHHWLIHRPYRRTRCIFVGAEIEFRRWWGRHCRHEHLCRRLLKTISPRGRERRLDANVIDKKKKDGKKNVRRHAKL